MRFDEMDFKEEFDGIWACASLLHVPNEELPDEITEGTNLKYEMFLYEIV